MAVLFYSQDASNCKIQVLYRRLQKYFNIIFLFYKSVNKIKSV